MSIFKLAHFAALIGVLPSIAWSSPSVNSISTGLENEYSISGSGFGSGPNIEIYDDFERSKSALAGQKLDLLTSIRGAWEPTTLEQTPVYDTDSRSGNYSALTWDNSRNKLLQLDHKLNNPIQSLYLSYWVKIPAGYPFPGIDNLYDGFSKDSSWKFAWIYDASYSGADADLCLPTHVGYGSAQLGGNDMVLTWLPKLTTWWSWGNWVRISTHLDTNITDPTLPGEFTFQTWSKEFGLQTVTDSKAIFDLDGSDVKQFQRLHIPGWIREFNNGEGRPLYDDIYLASGPNALARVEVTNNENYELSDEFAIQNITAWSESEIRFSWINGDLSDDAEKFIHVFHADGSHSSAPFLAQKATPKPPTLNIN